MLNWMLEASKRKRHMQRNKIVIQANHKKFKDINDHGKVLQAPREEGINCIPWIRVRTAFEILNITEKNIYTKTRF